MSRGIGGVQADAAVVQNCGYGRESGHNLGPDSQWAHATSLGLPLAFLISSFVTPFPACLPDVSTLRGYARATPGTNPNQPQTARLSDPPSTAQQPPSFGVFQILPPDTPKKGVPTAPTTNDTKGGVQQTLGVNGCLGSAAPPLPHRARNASGAAPETRPAGPAGLPENLRTSPLRPGLHWGCIALHRPRTSAATGAYKATGAGRSYGLVFAQFVRAECTTTDGRALHVTPPGVPQP
eukprot:CAMPEP_0174303112 /NCGR_PEP_ID=MMETSP0809-20121228/59994_1 /TAXON_ID=73025 ORGANISM="Eutreptiella gymnastica-like, Strain CCMP1594" /NCGR_SAMPLE_ID=MMETSP0809 /ASSEMBLY_ACC=CAM_ASM_000658 /LENGTH=236 /DNA_ID=CAMNT_0015409079 /DNA_START=164 /DNA_END=875 /DNA_ORIENTATION=-